MQLELDRTFFVCDAREVQNFHAGTCGFTDIVLFFKA